MAVELGSKEKRLLGIVGAVVLFALVGPEILGEYANQYRSEKSSEKSSKETRLQELQADLDGIEDRKEILRRYINRYQNLVDSNVLDLPNAVDVVRHMKEISTERKQNATEFSFSNNEVLAPARTSYTKDSTIGVNVYPLNIEMGMLHDMDMFMFLESLEKRLPNISFPVQCIMSLEEADFTVANRENMRGSCRIAWYGVRDPERSSGEAAATQES